MNFSLNKKPVTLTGDLKFRRKNNWFVTGTFCFVTGKNQKLSRALLQICKNCHGHFSFFTGIFFGFFVTGNLKYGVFCHGHFFKITGTFSKSVTDKPKNVTGKKTLKLWKHGPTADEKNAKSRKYRPDEGMCTLNVGKNRAKFTLMQIRRRHENIDQK